MYSANAEPSLEELLTDPVARLLMQRDGLRPEQVRSCIGAVQEKLRLTRPVERLPAQIGGVRSAEWARPCYCARGDGGGAFPAG